MKVIKKIFNAILYGLAWILSLVFNNFVLCPFKIVAGYIGVINFRRRLRCSGKRIKIGSGNTFEGLKNITIGDGFVSDKGLWLATYSEYAGEKFAPHISIGNNVHFSRYCHIGAVGNIVISDNVLLGSNVLINDHAHGTSVMSNVPRTEMPLVSKGGIVIGKNVWIGDNACILSGVTIGDNCIVGANSVVTKSFEESGLIIAGSPAKIIKKMENPKG